MDCAEGFLEELGSEGYRPVGEGLNARIDDSNIFLVDTLAESFLEKLPLLRDGHNAWWAS